MNYSLFTSILKLFFVANYFFNHLNNKLHQMLLFDNFSTVNNGYNSNIRCNNDLLNLLFPFYFPRAYNYKTNIIIDHCKIYAKKEFNFLWQYCANKNFDFIGGFINMEYIKSFFYDYFSIIFLF